MAKLLFKRASIGGVEWCKPHFVLDDGEDRERFAEQIRQMLVNFPELVYFVLVFDVEPTPPKLVGFLLAGWERPKPFIWLYQAWINPEFSGESFTDSVFIRLLSWAEELNVPNVRMETKRDPSAVHRKWGFEPISQIMSLNVQDAMKSLVYKPAKKEEVQDGQRITEHGKQLESPTAEPSAYPSATATEPGGEGSQSIQRRARRPRAKRPADSGDDKQLQPDAVPIGTVGGDQPSAVGAAIVQSGPADNGELLPKRRRRSVNAGV